MFDIGFSELLVIAVVALLVLGPERLPKAARFAGLWVRKARAQWYSVKSEFEREMAADELKRSVGNPLADLRTAASDAARELGDTRRELGDALRDTEALARADSDAATAVQDIPAADAPAVQDAPAAISFPGQASPAAAAAAAGPRASATPEPGPAAPEPFQLQPDPGPDDERATPGRAGPPTP